MSWVLIGGRYWDTVPLDIVMDGVCGPLNTPRSILWNGVRYYTRGQYTPADVAELESKLGHGTRLPTAADRQALIDVLGGWHTAGGALKSETFGGSNASGFGMLPTADLLGVPPSFYPQTADGGSYDSSPLPPSAVYNYACFWLDDTYEVTRTSDEMGSYSDPYGLVVMYRVSDTVPYTAPPSIYPGTSTLQGVQLVTIQGQGTLRYTLDGTEPTAASPVYLAPFRLTSSATVKAKAYVGGIPSDTTTAVLTIQGAEIQAISNYRDHVLPYLLEQYKGDNA